MRAEQIKAIAERADHDGDGSAYVMRVHLQDGTVFKGAHRNILMPDLLPLEIEESDYLTYVHYIDIATISVIAIEFI